MTSILHNGAASAALQTLRSIQSGLSNTQSQVGSGLKVSKASDNVAYWSISTTMKSDSKAISAANDVMSVGASKVATAYAGLESTLDILSEFKSKLVTAKESSVDKTKVQQELDQLKQQAQSIASGASFNGENWLNTNVDDLYDETQNEASVVSSFTRDQDGGVSVHSLDVDLSTVSLFNSTGGGLLQADPRDLKTIGGLRFDYGDGDRSTYTSGSGSGTRPSDFVYDFTAPMTFGATDSISFDITVDAENPADPITPPYNPGQTSTITIDKNLVDSVLGRNDGVISNYDEYASVLSAALSGSGATATTYGHYEPPGTLDTWVETPNKVGITHLGISSLDGSSMEITNLSASAGLGVTNQISNETVEYGQRDSSVTLNFQPFTVYDNVVVSMDMNVDQQGYTPLSFNKDFVNSTLGVEDGKVSTADEMATLMGALINRSDIAITTSGNAITIGTDPLVDRRSGEKSAFGFYNINVNIEPIPTQNFMDIDIASNPDGIDSDLNYIQTVFDRVTDAAATLGSMQNRMDMQSNFAKTMMNSLDEGVSGLVDADMEEASARLSALQTQQQLAMQSLQIANSAPSGIMSLFR
jgi:flagellin